MDTEKPAGETKAGKSRIVFWLSIIYSIVCTVLTVLVGLDGNPFALLYGHMSLALIALMVITFPGGIIALILSIPVVLLSLMDATASAYSIPIAISIGGFWQWCVLVPYCAKFRSSYSLTDNISYAFKSILRL